MFMTNMPSKLALVALIGVVTPATAADGLPPAYECVFEQGNSWSFDAGKFVSKPPSKLIFEVTDIDLEKQTAVLNIDSKQAGTLRVVRALNANSFLEVANEGFLNLTTVYDLDTASGTYPAVHSRHFGVFGQPVVAQYVGSCKGK